MLIVDIVATILILILVLILIHILILIALVVTLTLSSWLPVFSIAAATVMIVVVVVEAFHSELRGAPLKPPEAQGAAAWLRRTLRGDERPGLSERKPFGFTARPQPRNVTMRH